MLLIGIQSSIDFNWIVAGTEEDGEREGSEGEPAPYQRILDFAADGKLIFTKDHPNIVKMYEMF